MCWDLSLHINFCINTLVFYSVGYVTQTRTASGFNHKQARANEKGFFSTNLICWCIYMVHAVKHKHFTLAAILLKPSKSYMTTVGVAMSPTWEPSWEAGYVYSGSRNYDFWLLHLAGWAVWCLHRLKYTGTFYKRPLYQLRELVNWRTGH